MNAILIVFIGNFSQLLSPITQKQVYLDPGSGSFIIQVLVASAAGIFFVFRNSIRNFFRKVTGRIPETKDEILEDLDLEDDAEE